MESEIEKENYLVVLEDYPSENTVFKICPPYQYQQDS